MKKQDIKTKIEFDIYFNPKKFFNSHWVKKEIKELNK